MATKNDLNNVLDAFLTVAAQALALTDAGAPGRAFVSASEPALDCCGQLTVWWSDITDIVRSTGSGGLVAAKAAAAGRTMPTIGIFVQATRCSEAVMKWDTKSRDLPRADLLDKDAKMVGQDAWVLRLKLLESIREGLLSRVCSGVEFLGATPVPAQGECIGCQFAFRYPTEGGRLS